MMTSQLRCNGCGIVLNYPTNCEICGMIDNKFCYSCHNGNHLWSPRIKYRHLLLGTFISLSYLSMGVLML